MKYCAKSLTYKNGKPVIKVLFYDEDNYEVDHFYIEKKDLIHLLSDELNES